MTSLHERLCNWVQIHHLYQPTRNGLLDAYLRHHVAHCRYCQEEIQSIEALGVSIADLNFDVASEPSDVTWARLSAALPPRVADTIDTEATPVVVRQNLVPKSVAITAIACTGVAFAAIFVRGHRTENPTVSPAVAITAMPPPTLSAAKPPAEIAPDAALAATRRQAMSIATIDGDESDPFSKPERAAISSATLPTTMVKSPNQNLRPGKKQLVIATSDVDRYSVGATENASMDAALDRSNLKPQGAPQLSMRASAMTSQSDQAFGSANASAGGGGFAATPVGYVPSAAMELTESQNRLRSLLQ
ncbi:MAG: hypothetical protein ACKO14_03310 [Armatimonadota bacterium]